MRQVLLALLFSLLITAGAWISLPIGPVPFSLQTLFVFLAGFLLPMNIGVFSIIIYVTLGVIGLPVFAGGSSGLEVLMGPTSGFIFGFLFAVIFISYFAKSMKMNANENSRMTLYFNAALPCIGATLIVQLCGILWGKYYTEVSWVSIYNDWVHPFYFNMIFKAMLAVILSVEIWVFMDSRQKTNLLD